MEEGNEWSTTNSASEEQSGRCMRCSSSTSPSAAVTASREGQREAGMDRPQLWQETSREDAEAEEDEDEKDESDSGDRG